MASQPGRADHLHEHFIDPCIVADGHYLLPEQPGYIRARTPSRGDPRDTLSWAASSFSIGNREVIR